MTRKMVDRYVYGMHGQGTTATKAREHAVAKLQRAARVMQDQQPQIYHYNGHTIVAWSTLESSTYTIVRPDTGNGHVYSCCSMAKGQYDAMRYARLHLAETLEDVEAAHPNDRKVAAQSIKRQRAFTACYRTALSEGMDAQQAHRYACNNYHKAA